MGADYHATAMIGCEVTKLVISEGMTKNCEHDNPPGAKFCSTCGKPAMRSYKENRCEEDRDLRQAMKASGVVVLCGTDSEPYVAGLRRFCTTSADLNEGDSTRVQKVTRQDLAAAYDETKRVLEPLGLWDEASFGLWMVGYCSY